MMSMVCMQLLMYTIQENPKIEKLEGWPSSKLQNSPVHIIYVYNSTSHSDLNKKVGRQFSKHMQTVMQDYEIPVFYSNINSLDPRFADSIYAQVSPSFKDGKPRVFAYFDGHYQMVLFEDFEDDDRVLGVFKRVVGFALYGLEKEFLDDEVFEYVRSLRSVMMFEGHTSGPLWGRFLMNAAVHEDVAHTALKRPEDWGSAPQVSMRMNHDVDRHFMGKETHAMDMRGWMYTVKYQHALGERVSWYEESEHFEMMHRSEMPSVLLVCSTNDCRKQTEMMNEVVQRHKFKLFFSFMFEEKLEDDDLIVSRIIHEEKPLVLILEMKSKHTRYFLLKDNVKYFEEGFSRFDIDTFILKYLETPEKMVEYFISEPETPGLQVSEHANSITGNSCESISRSSHSHLILVYDNSTRGSIEAYENWIHSYGGLLSRLKFSLYNQLDNACRYIGIFRSSPLLIYIEAGKSIEDSYKKYGHFGLPLTNGQIDDVDMYNYLYSMHHDRDEVMRYKKIVDRERGIEDEQARRVDIDL